MALYQRKAELESKKYWNERRRNYRLQKATSARKLEIKRLKTEAYKLRAELEAKNRDLKGVEAAYETTFEGLHGRYKKLEEGKQALQQVEAFASTPMTSRSSLLGQAGIMRQT